MLQIHFCVPGNLLGYQWRRFFLWAWKAAFETVYANLIILQNVLNWWSVYCGILIYKIIKCFGSWQLAVGPISFRPLLTPGKLKQIRYTSVSHIQNRPRIQKFIVKRLLIKKITIITLKIKISQAILGLNLNLVSVQPSGLLNLTKNKHFLFYESKYYLIKSDVIRLLLNKHYLDATK